MSPPALNWKVPVSDPENDPEKNDIVVGDVNTNVIVEASNAVRTLLLNGTEVAPEPRWKDKIAM